MTARPFMWLEGGERLYFENPDPKKIKAETIGRAAGRLPRWSGQPRKFYSVAEHSIWAAEMARWLFPKNTLVQLQALLHDSAEAYTGDVISPIKRLIQGYDDIENAVLHAIGEKYGVELYPKTPAVARVDLSMTIIEAQVLMGIPVDELVAEFGKTAVDRAHEDGNFVGVGEEGSHLAAGLYAHTEKTWASMLGKFDADQGAVMFCSQLQCLLGLAVEEGVLK